MPRGGPGMRELRRARSSFGLVAADLTALTRAYEFAPWAGHRCRTPSWPRLAYRGSIFRSSCRRSERRTRRKRSVSVSERRDGRRRNSMTGWRFSSFTRQRRTEITNTTGTKNPEWRLILRALREMSGFERGLFYDVPRGEAPRPVAGSRVFLHTTPAWTHYLTARARLDDGQLTPILTLRGLNDGERRLAVDWGASYGNTFLAIGPRDPALDLLDRCDPLRQRIEKAARALLHRRSPEHRPAEPWTRNTDLGDLVRSAYGVWTYWSWPPPVGSPRHVTLAPSGPDETLAGLLRRELPRRFPQTRFDAALAHLMETEGELFHDSVARARIPFQTRLGLPVLHNPYLVDRALRRLVNEGRARVFDDRGAVRILYHGPRRPLPDDMPEEEFARLSL